MIIRLILPFPPPELNPNKILHWTKKAKIKKVEKDLGSALSMAHKYSFGKNAIALSLIFHPETKRSFDLDNALASCKAILDGIAHGLGVDDKQFHPITIDFGLPDKLRPRVELTMESL